MTARRPPGRTVINPRQSRAALAVARERRLTRWVARLEAGATATEIADEEGMTVNGVYTALRKAGFSLERYYVNHPRQRNGTRRVIFNGPRPAWSVPGPALLAVVHAARDEMRWALGLPERPDV